MPDPLFALRGPDEPVAPDPAFAARLRTRIARALTLPQGVTVSDLPTTAVATGFVQGDLAYASLWVADAGATAHFFSEVLGWRYADRPGHPQVEGQRLHHGIVGGVEDWTLMCCFAVDDLDAALERVRTAGGDTAAIDDDRFGRTCLCHDDQGMPFALFEPSGGTAPAGEVRAEPPMANGDLGYVTMEVVDSRRFRDFFSAVLGWGFAPGQMPDGWQLEGCQPSMGMHGGAQRPCALPLYGVDDLDGAVARVRALGGHADDPVRHPYGRTSDCDDGRGVRFYLMATS